MSELVAGVLVSSYAFSDQVVKPRVGSTTLQFTNEGDVVMAWHIRVENNSEAVPWSGAPADGFLSAREAIELVLSLNSSSLQARAAVYSTTFSLNTTSPTPTPHPQTQFMTFVGLVTVSATPNAEQSTVALLNTSGIVASSHIRFQVTPVDETGLVILDGSDIAYNAKLRYSVDSVDSETLCIVAYEAMDARHLGECELPSLTIGTFTLVVFDAAGVVVGRDSNRFIVSLCPPTYSTLGGDDKCACEPGSYDSGFVCAPCLAGFYSTERGATECDACPVRETSDQSRTMCECEEDYYSENDECITCSEQVTCGQGSTVADWRLKPGVWRSGPDSTDLRTCRFGVKSCPGINASDDATSCDARGFGDWAHCGCGFIGPMCSECDVSYFLTWAGAEQACARCDAGQGWAPTIITGVVLGACLALLAVVLVKTGLKAKLLRYYKIGKSKTMILVQVCQVISQFSSISQGTGDGRTYAEPASTFVRILALTNFDVFVFGAGCSIPHATFYTTLALKTTVLPLGPVVLLWIWAGVTKKRRVAAKISLLWIEIVLTTGEYTSHTPNRIFTHEDGMQGIQVTRAVIPAQCRRQSCKHLPAKKSHERLENTSYARS